MAFTQRRCQHRQKLMLITVHHKVHIMRRWREFVQVIKYARDASKACMKLRARLAIHKLQVNKYMQTVLLLLRC